MDTIDRPPILRRYDGRCQDCGNYMKVRQVRFWASDMAYTVCAEHERAYRRVICWPVRDYYREGLGKR